MSTQGPDPIALARVADAALQHVTDGMILGLGTGRAAEAFIEKLGERVRGGLRVVGVATSTRSEALAKRLQIEVVPLERVTHVDIAVDGADEVTPTLGLTKGLGGALLRERVVASEAKLFIVLVTPEKLVAKLGSRTPIPIEVVPFAVTTVRRRLERLGGLPVLRQRPDGDPVVTDNQNQLLDTDFGPIDEPETLGSAVRAIPGVVDHGLFLGMAHRVLVGDPDAVRELR